MGQRRNQAYCKRFSSNMVEKYREKLNEKYYQKLLLQKGGGDSSGQELTRAESFILDPVCCLSWKTDL